MGLGMRARAVKALWSARRHARDAVLSRGGDLRTLRGDIAQRYIRGDGIEIGALADPLMVPPSARVRYVDRKDLAELRADFPELGDRDFVRVDVVDDGERLTSFADASLDFVIANHMIEHTQDPIGTLNSQVRVLRPGGALYLAIPDRRHTFDIVRSPTPLAHHLRDHLEGPAWSRRDHYREWVRLIERFDEPDVDARAAKLEADRASIHFHAWELEDFLGLLDHCRRELQLEARIAHAQGHHHEFVVVLHKDGG